jgi:hypothetical protein
MFDLFVFALCLALVAVTWAVVLVDDGMLLQPVQRHFRWSYRTQTGDELDEQWWFKPLWGCFKCVAGQLGLWGYLVRLIRQTHPDTLQQFWAAYSPWQHVLTVCATIFFACILNRLYSWTSQ